MKATILNQNNQWLCKDCSYLNTPTDYAMKVIGRGWTLISTCKNENCNKTTRLLNK